MKWVSEMRGASAGGNAVFATAKSPTFLFVLAAVLILGACATRAAMGHWASQPNRDLFQHMAALRSLIADLRNPSNPFVNTHETSRHFNPYWTAMAVLARVFDWTIATAIGVASFLSLSVLAFGYFLFGRTYFRSEWGPLALLLCSLLAWSMPISHTGFVNIPTLVEGAAYPAVLLVGLSLILWAWIIRAFDCPAYSFGVGALCALMFSTHQLGAGLGFIVGTFLISFWPNGTMKRRATLLIAMGVGIAAATFWIYYNPVEAVIRAGNPTWSGGVEWYTPKYLLGILIPSALGIFGLMRPYVPGTGRPLLLALPVLVCGFASGAFGFLTGTRFAPTAALLLQIGLAAMLVRFLENPEKHGDRFKLALAGTAFGTLLFQAIALGLILYPIEYRDEQRFGSVLAAGIVLTDDIPDTREVAAFDVAAWPLVATGQKVLSVPWPEPFISDLSERQRKIDRLFDIRISRAQRVALAKQYGVQTLILDWRFGAMHRWRRWQLKTLALQSIAVRRSGPMFRFDLY